MNTIKKRKKRGHDESDSDSEDDDYRSYVPVTDVEAGWRDD